MRCSCTLHVHSTIVHSNSVVVETVSKTSHLCWNNETIRFKSSLTSIIIESTYLTLNINKIWGCFKVQVGWKMHFMGKLGLEKVSARPWPLKKHFLTFTLSVNKIIIYQFSMFKSLDSIASVVWQFQNLSKYWGLGKVLTTTLHSKFTVYKHKVVCMFWCSVQVFSLCE